MIVEAVLLLALSATFVRRGRRLRSSSALLASLVLLIPVAGLALEAGGITLHPAARGVALLTQALLTAGVIVEDVAEARLQERLARVDQAVEHRRVTSARARARAYTALQRVEERLGFR